jgi:hypothetical protein
MTDAITLCSTPRTTLKRLAKRRTRARADAHCNWPWGRGRATASAAAKRAMGATAARKGGLHDHWRAVPAPTGGRASAQRTVAWARALKQLHLRVQGVWQYRILPGGPAKYHQSAERKGHQTQSERRGGVRAGWCADLLEQLGDLLQARAVDCTSHTARRGGQLC